MHNTYELKELIEFYDDSINSKILAENNDSKAILFFFF